MPNPIAMVNYKKCHPEKCGNGVCAAALACPNKVLMQEAPDEYPYLNPARFCRACGECAKACPFEAIMVV